MTESRGANESDQDLVVRVLRGRKDAFGVIVQRYQRAIVNFTCRMVHDYETALDLSQEIFTKAYNSLDTYKPGYKFSTWLYRIATNHVIDFLRKKEPQWISIDQPGDEGDRPMEIPVERSHGIEQMAFEEKREKIEAAIQKLPPSYRRLIVLRHVNECSYDEIARICSLPLGTVKNRIFRAREMLRAALEGYL
ncbi:MAG: sigma-70 family RNA polymerase sigma factor [Acidobacteriota bacterium]